MRKAFALYSTVAGAALAGCATETRILSIEVRPQDAAIDVGYDRRWQYGLTQESALAALQKPPWFEPSTVIGVVARKPGYRTAAIQFAMRDRKEHPQIRIDLEPIAGNGIGGGLGIGDGVSSSAGVGPQGTLAITGAPGDCVYLSGRELGQLPHAPFSVEAGEYVLDVLRANGTMHQETIRVTPQGELRILLLPLDVQAK